MTALRDILWFKEVMKAIKARKPKSIRDYGIFANRADGWEELFAKLDADFPLPDNQGPWENIWKYDVPSRIKSYDFADGF